MLFKLCFQPWCHSKVLWQSLEPRSLCLEAWLLKILSVKSLESNVSRFKFWVSSWKNNELVTWLNSREMNWTNRPHSSLLYSTLNFDFSWFSHLKLLDAKSSFEDWFVSVTLLLCCTVFFFFSQMQKGNDVLKKAKSKSEQIEKKGDKVLFLSLTTYNPLTNPCQMMLGSFTFKQ